ncbi:MAG: hypothetical protein ACR2KV_07190 [Solirubrobacteraceae bacterium]
MLDSRHHGRRVTAMALTAIIAGAALASGAAAGSVSALDAAGRAKALARTHETVEETYFTVHQTYSHSRAALVRFEPSIAHGRFSVSATSTSYTIRVRASTGAIFRLIRFTGGNVRRSCSPRAAAGCTNGLW